MARPNSTVKAALLLMGLVLLLLLAVTVARKLAPLRVKTAPPVPAVSPPATSPTADTSSPSEGDSMGGADSWIRLDSEFATVATRVPILAEGLKQVPPPPFLVEGCEGEGCDHVKSLALTCESRFFSDPGPKGTLVFTLPEGTVLTKARIFTLVLKPGSVRLSNEEKTIPIVKMVNDGEWLTWEEGEFRSWSETSDEGASSMVRPVREPWAYVSDEEGRKGWVRMPAQLSRCPFESVDPAS